MYQLTGVGDGQPGSRYAPAGCAEHASGQVQAQHRARVPAPGQLSQVRAVPAADIGDCLATAQASQPEHQRRQVQPRVLIGVNGLPGGQVSVGAVHHGSWANTAQITSDRSVVPRPTGAKNWTTRLSTDAGAAS